MPSPSPVTEVRRARPLLGTLLDIRAAAPWPPPRLHAAIDTAFAVVAHVQRLMSVHDPVSDVSVLNREAARRAVRVHRDTYAVLCAAQRFAQLSQGAFDLGIADTLSAWGYLPASSTPSLAGAPSPRWRDIELLTDARVRFHRPLCIDLGGIAKGFAVDRAIDSLQHAGVAAAIVNAGGDLRLFGAEPQPVWLRHPQQPALRAGRLMLQNEALATSASYFTRRPQGASAVSALVNPHGRRPYLEAASVSVRAAEAMSADALTKVVLFAAPELAEQILAGCGAQALWQRAATRS